MKLTKTTLISGVIGIIAIVAIVLVIQKTSNRDVQILEPDQLENVSSGDTTSPAGGTMLAGKKMSFSEFVKNDKGSYQCTVDQYIDAGMSQSTKGTVFISNGNIRGDFSTAVQGMNVSTSMIVRDGFVYTWTSMAPTGFKSKAVEVVGGDAVVDSGTGTSGSYSWNATQIGDYDCKPWTPDASKFIVPTTITFKEV